MVEKNNTISSPPLYVLPSENKDLESFSKKFKVDMMEQVVGIIEFAVDNNLPIVEVFQFKNSDFVITLLEKDYLANLDNIYNYYMEREVYECCPRLVRLRKTIAGKVPTKKTDEKQTHRNK